MDEKMENYRSSVGWPKKKIPWILRKISQKTEKLFPLMFELEANLGLPI